MSTKKRPAAAKQTASKKPAAKKPAAQKPDWQQAGAASPATKRIMLAVGLVIVGLVAFFVFKPIMTQGKPEGGDPSNNIADLQAVKTYDYEGAQHTTDPVTYTESPPAGGPHDPVWEDCGVYTKPIRNENAVHALEHGTVWITYQPGTSATDVQTLQTALDSVKDKKTMLSPYPGQKSPVEVTVWNAQLGLNGADDPRLQSFLDFYGDGHTAPEAAMASCAGGVHNYASPDNP